MASCADRAEDDHRLLERPVPGCPGWDVRRLVVHTGWVHRWATQALRTGSAPSRDDVHEPDATVGGEELGAWLRLGAGVLVDVLAARAPDSDTWHPFPFEQKAWVWSRRQAHETTVHRWDTESTVLGSSDLSGSVSCDGLREYFEMMLPRAVSRDGHPLPAGSIQVRCTDDEQLSAVSCDDLQTSWTVWNDDGEYRMSGHGRDDGAGTAAGPGHDADAQITGDATSLLLALMGRADRSHLTVSGDETVAAAWLDLPGP